METIMSKKDVKDLLILIDDKINTYKMEMKGAGYSEFKSNRNMIIELMQLQEKLVLLHNENIDLKKKLSQTMLEE